MIWLNKVDANEAAATPTMSLRPLQSFKKPFILEKNGERMKIKQRIWSQRKRGKVQRGPEFG